MYSKTISTVYNFAKITFFFLVVKVPYIISLIYKSTPYKNEKHLEILSKHIAYKELSYRLPKTVTEAIFLNHMTYLMLILSARPVKCLLNGNFKAIVTGAVKNWIGQDLVTILVPDALHLTNHFICFNILYLIKLYMLNIFNDFFG